jgi:hypothetical protein
MERAFRDFTLLLHAAGDTFVVMPPWIVSEAQIGEIVEKTAQANQSRGVKHRASRALRSLCQARGGERLLEHRLHGVGNVLGRVGGKVKTGRSAGLKLSWKVWDRSVHFAVLVAREAGIGVRDRLIGNIQHRDGDAAILERRAWGRIHGIYTLIGGVGLAVRAA